MEFLSRIKLSLHRYISNIHYFFKFVKSLITTLEILCFQDIDKDTEICSTTILPGVSLEKDMELIQSVPDGTPISDILSILP